MKGISLLIRLRKELASAGVRVSVNDFVVKAAATALQYVPQMNLNVSGEDFEVSETCLFFLYRVVHQVFTTLC